MFNLGTHAPQRPYRPITPLPFPDDEKPASGAPPSAQNDEPMAVPLEPPALLAAGAIAPDGPGSGDFGGALSCDDLLGAIHLELNPQPIDGPRRNQVAGFDLAQRAHWGKPASTVVERLANHLISHNKATPELAKLAAPLLLARNAPEFLVQDIPATVPYGSVAWANLATAVAIIEADAPGTVPNMSFAEVMATADKASASADKLCVQRAQQAALKDWGVINGIVQKDDNDLYSDGLMNTIRDMFNLQQQDLLEASSLQGTTLLSRKEMALRLLEKTFGRNLPYEEKYLYRTLGPESVALGTGQLYSMLDIVMEGKPLPLGGWSSKHSRIPLKAFENFIQSPDFNVPATFSQQLNTAVAAYNKMISTRVHQLISELGLEDRVNLAHGRLKFFQRVQYDKGERRGDPLTVSLKSSRILVAAEYNGKTSVYEIDTRAGRIYISDEQAIAVTERHDSTTVHKLEEFTPDTYGRPALNSASRPLFEVPISYFSARTHYIANAVVKRLDLANTMSEQARGFTTFDKDDAQWEATKQFLLDLIPLRSAIVNYRDGKYGAGTLDLTLDLFGFIATGAGAAAKLRTLGRSGNTALKTLKIVGASTIEAFNPLNTLMPPSPNAISVHNPAASAQRHRYDPIHRHARPALRDRARGPNFTNLTAPKTDHLPQGEYLANINGAPNEAHFTPSRRQATQEKFDADMQEFYRKLEPLNQANRPVLPATKPYEGIPDLIEKALDSADVVVFGENHLNLATFRTLDDNMELFKRKNVKVIGIEGVVYNQQMQLKDNGMGRTGPGMRPADPRLNLEALMARFKANGIEVVPLDHFYLTRHNHERGAYTAKNTAERNLQRLKEFNYYAARELERHTHKGKVIALVGRQHINTTQGVTGLAEATGGIGIGVYERAGMKVGYGTHSMEARPGPMGSLTTHNDIIGDLQIFTPE